MMAMSVAVAFQTIDQTRGMSLRLITPERSARRAPALALQAILSPRGCQMTKTMVTTKIVMANQKEEARSIVR